MALDLATQFASIVAAYLRKGGFSRTLATFFRENGEISENEDNLDLETLYTFYISSQVNTDTRTKKSKKTNLAEGNEDIRNNAEEKANGGAASGSKKKKTKERENFAADSPVVSKTKASKTLEESGIRKKRKDSKPEEANDIVEGIESVNNGHVACDGALKEIVLETHVDNGGGLATQQEVTCPEKSSDKKTKKEKKEPGESKRTEPVDTALASLHKDDLSKKKRKKSKDAGAEETKDVIIAEAACKAPINLHTEQSEALEQPAELSGETVGCETGSKKKRRRKDLSLEGSGDLKGSIEETSDAKHEENKNAEELIESKKQSRKKRKLKEDTVLGNGSSNQDHNSMGYSEKTKEAGTGDTVDDHNVEKHDSGSAKAKKHKEIPNDKTPTGALAFRRVEVDKVSFSDPRLSDNSYWAKDGAEEGYGAKAQEVLGLVRGRDFRHEKTKKKRGSYRGGLIGMESHSIKFENSDED